jgi:peptidoglycan/xylan/chitin deacetylase (PgdA/CDA1 family)
MEARPSPDSLPLERASGRSRWSSCLRGLLVMHLGEDSPAGSAQGDLVVVRGRLAARGSAARNRIARPRARIRAAGRTGRGPATGDGRGGIGGRRKPPAGLLPLVCVVLGLLIAAASCARPTAATPSAATPAATSTANAVTVSLTFDDGLADQLGDVSILQRHGLTGTFYVNSGLIDQPGHLTRAGLTQIAEGGNEIAGHTTLHPDLRTLTPDEAQRQICGDRATLSSWGFHPTSFAYPFGYYNDVVKAAVAGCGYTRGRRVGGLGAPAPSCPGCIPAETTPAADPYQVRTPAEVTAATTVAELEQTVTDARAHGGGWLPLIFHHESTCTTCGDLSSNPACSTGSPGGWPNSSNQARWWSAP